MSEDQLRLAVVQFMAHDMEEDEALRIAGTMTRAELQLYLADSRDFGYGA